MKKTVKDTLMSVVVLFTIAFVCVALLSIANEYLKYEAKLDEKMAKQLYVVCPTGEETDENALEYFEILKLDDEIAAVNKEHGTPTTKVIAVYRSTKGDNEGSYIVQAQAHGNDSDVVMLTAYTGDGKILKTRCYSQTESYWQSKIAGKFDDFIALEGKNGEISSGDIAVGTGATNSLSAVARAVTISNKMADTLIGGGANE